jgi:hypothetical protein
VDERGRRESGRSNSNGSGPRAVSPVRTMAPAFVFFAHRSNKLGFVRHLDTNGRTSGGVEERKRCTECWVSVR